jgi:hypothetical protein
MKLSQLKQIIKEEIENSLKEAPKSSTLKPLDFIKFEKLLKLAVTPLPEKMVEDKDYEGDTLSGVKKLKSIEYNMTLLKKFSELYTAGDTQGVLDFLSKNANVQFGFLVDDEYASEILKNKKLGEIINNIEDKLQYLSYPFYEIDPDDTVRGYNELAGAIDKLSL